MRLLHRIAMTGAMLVCLNAHAGDTLPVIDKDIAHRIGTIPVFYNNRICPLNTVATDFVTRLSGSATWEGWSADEIFVSWMIYYSPWEQQKLIRVKSREVQQLLGISGAWASYSDFLDEHHEYKLKDAVASLQTGNTVSGGSAAGHSIDRKALLKADGKYRIVEKFYRGEFIRMFPYRIGGEVNWYMPGGQSLPREIPVKEQFFIKQAMDYLTESIVTGNRDRAFELIAKIKLFQRDMAGDLLPSENRIKAEIFFNTLRSQRSLGFLALALCLLLYVAVACFISRRKTIINR